MINRNAYHNAMRCGTLLSAKRSDAQHRATLLIATQRFVCYQRIASLRPAPQLRSTICLLSAQLSYANRTLTKRNAAPLNSAQRFVCYQRLASLRTAPPLCSTICLSQRAESIRGSRPLNSAQRFVCYLRFSAQGTSAILYAAQCFSTQQFVCYYAMRLLSATRRAPRLDSAQRCSTICLFSTPLYSTIRGETQLNSTRRGYPPRTTTQRNQLTGELNVPKITTNYKNMRYVS